jgi:hypothetical protein
VPFEIESYPEARIVQIDGEDWEKFRYTGLPGDSFFHSAGFLLEHSGSFSGNAATLRRLTATAIGQIYEAGAAPMADALILSLGFTSVDEYITAIAAGKQPGDLLCLIALEFHFNVYFELYEDNAPSLRLITHLSSPDCRTHLFLRFSAGAFSPLEMYELPALEALEYCLSCGAAYPPEGESICDNCVKRPKFCTSCGIAFVESKTAVCSFCTKRLSTALIEQSRSIGPADFETVVTACQASRRTAAVTPVATIEPPNFVLYLSNAPFDDFRSGDGTYMNKLVNWVSDQSTVVMSGLTYKIAAFRLCDAAIAKKTPVEERGVPLIEIPYIQGWPTSQQELEAMTMFKWQEFYQPARLKFLSKLIELRKADKNPKSIHIFHAQVRYPDSGALFNAEFFKELKENGFKVVVTCHEMEFNLLTAKNMQKTIVQMNQFVAEAQRTIFLNEYDLLLGAGLVDTSSLTAYVLNHCAEQLAERVKHELTNMLAVATDTINPKGIAEDIVDIPPMVKQTFFHIPGIATVGGLPFTADQILARPQNVLVFGLIKQKEAMDAAADVALALFNRRIDSKVFVVGKVFKDYQHTAIARLVRKMCFMTEREERALCATFDDIGRTTRDDQEFYEALNREIQRQLSLYPFKRLLIEARRSSVAGAEVQDVLRCCKACLQYLPVEDSSIVNAELEKIGNAAAQLDERTPRADAILAHAAEVKPLIEVLTQIAAAVDILTTKLPAPKKKAKQTSSASEPLPGQAERDAAGAAVERFKYKMTCSKTLAKLVGEYVPDKPLPIEIVFDAPPDLFQKIASRCKYAFKVDLKSMADNASSILSLMANGCITFTESRFDTPDEFRVDKTGGKLSPVILPPNPLGSCSGEFVATEIARRDADPSLNLATLKNMLTLLKKRYGIDAVAGKHMQVYKTLAD